MAATRRTGWAAQSIRATTRCLPERRAGSAALVCAHGDRQLDQHVDGVDPRSGRIESQQRSEERRAVREARGVFVHHLDLVALEHSHVDKLPDSSPGVLDDQQPGRATSSTKQ